MIPWEVLWYLVIGASILMYVVLDGFDLGVGILHPVGRNDTERRTFLNAIGPVWDGNEVWIVIVMGALFAGFPNAYATIFSGFYSLLMILIPGLMFRAAAIEFRSKRASPLWRSFWDYTFFASSLIVAFVIGLLFGNFVEGVPLNAQQDFVGDFSLFFRPYSLLVSLTAICLFMMHGAIYLSMKTEGDVQTLVHRWVNRSIAAFIASYLLLTLATLLFKPHMIERLLDTPSLWIFPLLSFSVICSIPYRIRKGQDGLAFLSSCLSIALLLLLFGIGTFPTLVYSTLNPDAHTLTIYNSASSTKTLQILSLVVAIGLPLVLAYGLWIYRVFRGKVRLGPHSY
jgi:cytochrome d ubiquinol oxidase subunit II